MFRVYGACGDMLAEFPVDAEPDVRTVKRRLTSLCGANRFRQRLVQRDAILEDAAALVPGDVQLVVLPFADADSGKAVDMAQAAEHGDLAAMEKLLRLGQNPNDMRDGSFVRAPLHGAADRGHLEAVKLLLEGAADPNIPSRGIFTTTPLSEAASNGYSQIVGVLLQAAADPNPSIHILPLWCCVAANHTDIACLLLEARADADAPHACNPPMYYGRSPLAHVSAKGHIELVRLLLKAGAAKDKVDNAGATPLWLASAGGHSKVVRLLLEAGADKNLTRNRQSPLFVGALKGRRSRYLEHPLRTARQNKQWAVASLLSAHSAALHMSRVSPCKKPLKRPMHTKPAAVFKTACKRHLKPNPFSASASFHQSLKLVLLLCSTEVCKRQSRQFMSVPRVTAAASFRMPFLNLAFAVPIRPASGV